MQAFDQPRYCFYNTKTCRQTPEVSKAESTVGEGSSRPCGLFLLFAACCWGPWGSSMLNTVPQGATLPGKQLSVSMGHWEAVWGLLACAVPLYPGLASPNGCPGSSWGGPLASWSPWLGLPSSHLPSAWTLHTAWRCPPAAPEWDSPNTKWVQLLERLVLRVFVGVWDGNRKKCHPQHGR